MDGWLRTTEGASQRENRYLKGTVECNEEILPEGTTVFSLFTCIFYFSHKLKQ